MRHRVALLGFVLFATSSAFAQTSLETVEKELLAKWKDLKSLSAKFKIVGDGGGMKYSGEGVIETILDEKEPKVRQDISMVMEGGEQKMESKLSTFFDGKEFHMLVESMGMKNAIKDNPDKAVSGVGGKQFFDKLKSLNELKVLEDKKVGDEECYVLLASPKDRALNPELDKTICYFSKSSGFLCQVETLGQHGQQTITFSDVKKNPDIPADRFVFKAPDGVMVMDNTSIRVTPSDKTSP